APMPVTVVTVPPPVSGAVDPGSVRVIGVVGATEVPPPVPVPPGSVRVTGVLGAVALPPPTAGWGRAAGRWFAGSGPSSRGGSTGTGAGAGGGFRGVAGIETGGASADASFCLREASWSRPPKIRRHLAMYFTQGMTTALRYA